MPINKDYKRIRVQVQEHIAEVVLNRPDRLNSMDDLLFEEIHDVFKEIDKSKDIHVVILWAEGRVFTAGLDLKSAGNILASSKGSIAVQNIKLFHHIGKLQDSFQAIHKCRVPVIAAVHSKCIGGGVDLITACDIRLATQDASFSIRETKIAIVADLGTLQRISKIVGKGFAREMAFTGDDFDASTCHKFGLVNRVFQTKEEMLQAARRMAKTIASNSPLVVQGTKRVLNYSDDHSLEDSLMHVRLWNSAFLKSEDLGQAIMAFMQKKNPVFKNSL